MTATWRRQCLQKVARSAPKAPSHYNTPCERHRIKHWPQKGSSAQRSAFPSRRPQAPAPPRRGLSLLNASGPQQSDVLLSQHAPRRHWSLAMGTRWAPHAPEGFDMTDRNHPIVKKSRVPLLQGITTSPNLVVHLALIRPRSNRDVVERLPVSDDDAASCSAPFRSARLVRHELHTPLFVDARIECRLVVALIVGRLASCISLPALGSP